MKQITIVLHYDDDDIAQRVYEELRRNRRDAGTGKWLVVDLMTQDIRALEIRGPND